MKREEKKVRRLVILGAGESGVGAALLAKKKGWEVFVTDKGKIKEKYRNVLLHHDIAFEEGTHTESRILNADEVMKSPGIPEKAAILKKIRRKGIPVISEIELGARYTKGQLIGITGTNGKTTTTSLTYHILKKAGYNVRLGGNIGKSFAAQVAKEKKDEKDLFYVLELSSFQLDDMFTTRINVAVLTNITPDHLDSYRYRFQSYINSKFRITRNQTRDDAFIFCADDPVIMKEIRKRKFQARLFPFSIKKQFKQGAFIKNGKLTIHTHKTQFNMFVEQLALQGKHNQYNSMAAGIAARLVEVSKNEIRESLSDFQNIEHRLEFVSRVHGVEYINDSKATNVNSTWYALESMQHPTVWIVGGVDKGNDYSMLKDLVKEHVKAIVCLGTDNKKIIKAFAKDVDTIVETRSADEAVRAASRLATKGDAVLLSPCCASFDLFDNYEDRGRKFKQAVKAL